MKTEVDYLGLYGGKGRFIKEQAHKNVWADLGIQEL